MGAGLAGGVAFAAREVIRFGAAAVEAASALQEQASATDALFGSASRIVEVFAQGAAAIGLSERAALQASNTFGDLFTNLGLSDESAASLSVALTALAADLASFKDITPEDALIKLQAGLVGETEALRRLGVVFDEAEVKARAAELGFGAATGELSQGEKVLTRYQLILEKTGNAQGDVARTSDSLANRQRQMNAEWENAQASLGKLFIPLVNEATKELTTLVKAGGKVLDIFDALGESAGVDSFGEKLRRNLPITGGLLPIVAKGLERFVDSGEDAADTSDELAEAAKILGLEETKLAAALGLGTDSMQDQEKQAEDLADAHKKLAKALEDSEDRIGDAERSLARALEDAELRVDAAERNLAKAFEDRADRIADAERQLIDARRDAVEKAQDAQEDLKEAQLDGARAIRDAERNLRDFQIDSARRVADAEDRILDIRREQAKAIVAANLSIEEAQRAGDAEAENRARAALAEAQSNDDIKEARKDAAQQRKDDLKERKRLEEELAETIQESAKKIAQAEEDLSDTEEEINRRIADAKRNLVQVEEDSAERIADAQRQIRDAHRESAQSVEDAQRRLNDAIEDGTESINEARDAYLKLADSAERARTAMQLANKEAERLADILLNPQFVPELVPKGSLADVLLNPEFTEGGVRQHGGPVKAGGAYLVGERGPELVVPSRSGTVVGNDELIRVLRQMVEGRGGSSVSIGQIVTGNTDARVLANELSFKLMNGVN